VGIYSVISYSVTQRTHEIGIRLAVGAHVGEVLRLVVARGMRLALTGIIIGLAASYSLSRLMSSLLFGVASTDVPTYTAVAFLLAAAALAACYVPALRASRIDPAAALRLE
jgi:putative ABC transport system permease protein